MKISLKITRKNEDGSADAVVDYDDEGLVVIVQYGVIAMLEEGMKNMKENKNMKKKKVSSEMQTNLEDSIEAFYTLLEDIKLLYKTHGDRKTPMDENEMANALLGLITKSEMLTYWATNAYERAFQLNDYASDEAKARRAAIMGWVDDDGRC